MAVPPTTVSMPPQARDGLPTTFRERGVSVPFTTPLLTGARVREAERGGTELVVPNPSGGRGVYVLPCDNLRAMCRPSVHDARLNQKITVLPSITPASVRDAAREVAATGLAGREAMAAALAAAKADAQDRKQIETALLAALERQLGPAIEPLSKTRHVAERLAPLLGSDPQSAQASLKALVDTLLSVGLPGQPPVGRTARLVERLASLGRDLDQWLCDPDQWLGDAVADSNADLADMILCAAEIARGAADTALATARGSFGDPANLLRAFTKSPELVAQRISRPEWLLDGWEPVCLLWQCAEGPAGRHGTLVEMARVVPSLPREALEWLALSADGVAMEHRRVGLDAAFRSGSLSLGLAARNERLRALAI